MSDSFPETLDDRPLYPGMGWSSQYVSMRDGVRLAVDVYLPKGLPTNVRLPAVLIQSRYWRTMEPRPPISWFVDDAERLMPVIGGMKAFFVRRGYVLVNIDLRGTGASFGKLRYPWDPICLQDAWDILEWIIAQPWSDGNVAGMGVSYLGTTAELLLATRHPAVKAVVPMYNHPDPYVDIAFPGGLFNQRFVYQWSQMDHYLDLNKIPPQLGILARTVIRSVRPVQGDREILAEVVNEHRDNGNAYQIAYDVTYRDEYQPEVGVSVDQLAMHHHRQAILDSHVPSYGWASWLDAATAEGALRRFLDYPGADEVTIGAWCHGGPYQASPYRGVKDPISPPIEQQWADILRFFDRHLRGVVDESNGTRKVRYYTLGAEKWQSSPTWPPAEVKNQRWHLAANGALSKATPEDDSGLDEYQVDFQASTGLNNRWWELGAATNETVYYTNRAAQAERLLTYLTPVFEEGFEICGAPIIHLEVACSVADCAFFVYLEDVAPNGDVYYLTEGLLRTIHRRISASPPYPVLGPYHSFRQADALPLNPGEPSELLFSLLTISAWIEAGHRLRLGLAGHDEGTFPRLPGSGEVRWQVLRNSVHASWLDLPVKG